MKKIFAATLSALTLLGCMSLTASAETETLSANVFVTIASKGDLAVTQENVTVTDADDDGTLTINDALYAAHEAKYQGGAAAGYATAETEWGLSITKLWGDESGNYGYYINNASAWSLTDPVKDGDRVNAFVYSDGEALSDTYCYFDVNTISADAGKDITVTLSGAGYDAEWNPITVAIEGATVTVNGKATDVRTDSNGKAIVHIAESGSYVISAASDTQTLVPPVCVATVAASATIPDTGYSSHAYLYLALMAVSLCGILAVSVMKEQSYEK